MESYYDTILNSIKRKHARAYKPRFRVKRDTRGWWILDADQTIGYVFRDGQVFFDIWAFSPFEPPIRSNSSPMGKIADPHTVQNTMLQIPIEEATDLVGTRDDTFNRIRFRWVEKEGPQLHMRMIGLFTDDQRLDFNFHIRYDANWSRYRYTMTVDVWKHNASGLTPVVMTMPGALASRPERRRWTHSIWEDPENQLIRLVHSNVLFNATDFKDPKWRTRSTPKRKAWIGYASHDRFNPALLIHDSNVPIQFFIGSQFFNEHIVWDSAGFDQLDGGQFHFHLKTELVNMPVNVSRHLLDDAVDPPHPDQWRTFAHALAFRVDEENHLEENLEVWEPEECPILIVPNEPDPNISWVSDESHSEHHSLHFKGRHPSHRVELTTTGAACTVTPNSTYRFTAWIKTSKVERFARVELFTYEYSPDNVIDIAQSEKVSGTRTWQKVTVEINTGDEAYVMPRLQLYGSGDAWFDDLRLEQISAPSSPKV